ncbi:glycoside hydrolase family 65 protein [Streptomyces sp. NPDC053750]|uniref:glycoside hydrolase family 65 protein n=1 Tax=Streptomyces sp. NPDC053750 TaxID=3365714 RepID=UPI0037CEF57F
MSRDSEWVWEYEGYRPDEEGVRETLCVLGNGVFGVRAAVPGEGSGAPHYRGSYAAGCYSRSSVRIEGHTVHCEAMANLPDWLWTRLRPCSQDEADEPWLSVDRTELLRYRLELDLRRGGLTRLIRYRDRRGRQTRVVQRVLLSMDDPTLALVKTTVTAENWHGILQVESSLDGSVTNSQVDRYSAFGEQYLTDFHSAGQADRGIVLMGCRTLGTGVSVALAAATHALDVRNSVPTPGRSHDAKNTCPRRPGTVLHLSVVPGRDVEVVKTVTLLTSRTLSPKRLAERAAVRVASAPHPSELTARHEAAWRKLWSRSPQPSSTVPKQGYRLHQFHLLQTLSPHITGLDAGFPARGLHGEEYQGRIFWDELFAVPWLSLHWPRTARALLDYRYRRLPAARAAAAATGLKGALYPWQSAASGSEATVPLVLNPLSGRWTADHSALQRHINSAIAYSVHQYVRLSGDLPYLHARGAEVIIETARMWASTAARHFDGRRYHIVGVMGPDEYHDAYPGNAVPGLRDNAYTNVTAAWTLQLAHRLWHRLPAPQRERLTGLLSMTPDEPQSWPEISHRLYVPFHDGVISQFDGYGELAEFDWNGYRSRYRDLRRLDRILEREGDHPNRYRLSKQADALMLGYVFSPKELLAMLQHMGYSGDIDLWQRTVAHYLPRTTHGSTLSAAVHAHVLGDLGHPAAAAFARRALRVDTDDTERTGTPYGIHLGAMAAALRLATDGTTQGGPRPTDRNT